MEKLKRTHELRVPLTLTSSLSRPMLPISKPFAPIPRNEDYGPVAKTPPVTGYEPNVTDTSDDFEVTPSYFEGSNEIYDEYIRNALVLSLSFQESEAEASLRQTYHYNEEGLFKGAQSILARTGQPVARLPQKRKSRQELDDGQIRIILEGQKGTNARRSKNPISWKSTKRILLKMTFVSPKHWKLGTVSQDTNSPDRNLLQEEQAD